MNSPDPKRVFVVYGRNGDAYDAMRLFLTTLGLSPLTFDEVKNELGGAPFVGQIVHEGMLRANAIVVLFTPDEFASLRESLASPHDGEADRRRWQARPNVLLEAGMALAFDERKTILVMLGQTDLPSDLHGRHYIRLNNSAAARSSLRAALKGTGCQVTDDPATMLNLKLSGDFEACIAPPPANEPPAPLVSLERNAVEHEALLFCKADQHVRKNTPLYEELISDEDDSDLNYLLLNVANCAESRAIIKQVMRQWANANLLGTPRPAHMAYRFRLTGMYDIMGKWDLMVRFRLPELKPTALANRIGEELVKAKQIDNKDRVIHGLFNIKQELFFNSDHKPTPPAAPGPAAKGREIKHVRFKSTKDYDDTRSQRAFLYVQLPLLQYKELIADLRQSIGDEPELASIIESFAIGDNSAVLEVFMRCSQTHLINRLNRLVEEHITKPQYRVTKYTLSCYEYDEEEVAV